jgi:AraC-like DNA-binding protein
LKESNLSISEIAEDSGFATSQHFARIFRQQAGSTAAEYRRERAPLIDGQVMTSSDAAAARTTSVR